MNTILIIITILVVIGTLIIVVDSYLDKKRKWGENHDFTLQRKNK